NRWMVRHPPDFEGMLTSKIIIVLRNRVPVADEIPPCPEWLACLRVEESDSRNVVRMQNLHFEPPVGASEACLPVQIPGHPPQIYCEQQADGECPAPISFDRPDGASGTVPGGWRLFSRDVVHVYYPGST